MKVFFRELQYHTKVVWVDIARGPRLGWGPVERCMEEICFARKLGRQGVNRLEAFQRQVELGQRIVHLGDDLRYALLSSFPRTEVQRVVQYVK